MKKNLFIFLSLLPFTLKAAPGPMPMPAPQGGGLFGAQNEVESDDVLIMAYDVRRDLMSKQELNSDLISEIEQMIRDCLEQEDQRILKAYKLLLRRYNKVAHICQRANFNQLEYLQARSDLEKRKRLIAEMITEYTKLDTAQHIIQHPEQYLPQGVTDAQQKQYYEQFQKMYDKKTARIKEIQTQLNAVEVRLLKDPRTFWEKYGGLLVGSTVALTSIIGAGLLGNAAGMWWQRRQAKRNGGDQPEEAHQAEPARA